MNTWVLGSLFCQRLASRLENEPTILDGAARDELQHEAYHAGHLMQHIGALLLELGRATLSLRMGQCAVSVPELIEISAALLVFVLLAPIKVLPNYSS